MIEKEQYTEPELQLIVYSLEDVIHTSHVEDEGQIDCDDDFDFDDDYINDLINGKNFNIG